MQEAKRYKGEESQPATTLPPIDNTPLSATTATTTTAPSQPKATQKIAKPVEEVKRRLRVLKQPITLFGETDEQRQQRLSAAEQSVQVDDEAAGGQQDNLHIALQREDKAKARRQQVEAAQQLSPHHEHHESATLEEQRETTTVEQQQLMVSFHAAAEAVAEKSMGIEDRILKWLQRWMDDWAKDLEQRSEEMAASATGRQSDMRFKETQQYLRPLYSRLKQRSLDAQLLAGIKLIVDAMKERNYLHAYKIYMGVAIGNSPWPIGVTQVGLHERASREKISFKYSTGSAHIMNDEATRKFIQALKRLMTFCQRRYPTDPSRSVDFDGFVHEGRGGAGAGSDKVALLEAVARGDMVTPAPAPSHIDSKGAVKIPEKWDQVLRGALGEVAASDAAEEREEQQQQRSQQL